MKIRNITDKDKNVVEQIAKIHLNTFKGFFLTFMGESFLKLMYRSYLEHEESGILVAFDDNNPVGFLAYSANLSGLYKYMIKKRLIQFAFNSLGAFFRKPAVFLRLVRALLMPAEAKREEKYVELASIGVEPEVKSKGIGSALIDALKEQVDFSVYEYILLETDAENNEGANHFYLKNSFEKVREFETHEGRRMNEYRYRKEK